MIKKHFTVLTMILGATVALATAHILESQLDRRPAASDQLELTLKTLSLSSTSSLHSIHGAHVRVTFNQKDSFDFMKDTPIALARGQSLNLSSKVSVKEKWIRDNTLEFKVELVGKNMLGMEQIIVRCQQLSKEVETLARGYQCQLPGDSQPFLTYRLGPAGSDKSQNMRMASK